MKSKTIIQGHEIAGRMPLFQEWGRKQIPTGGKTQTRRIMKPQPTRSIDAPHGFGDRWWWKGVCSEDYKGKERMFESFLEYIPIKLGDIRVMTEPLRVGLGGVKYQDDGQRVFTSCVVAGIESGAPLEWRWKRDFITSVHMPHEAARTLCRITGVRVDQLQEISEEDARAEGVPFTCSHCGNDETTDPDGAIHWACDDPEYLESSYREGFKRKWDDINEDRGYPWSKPQLVIAYTFEVV